MDDRGREGRGELERGLAAFGGGDLGPAPAAFVRASSPAAPAPAPLGHVHATPES